MQRTPPPFVAQDPSPRIWRALRASGRGLVSAARSEAAFRQELWLAVVVLPAGLWLGNSPLERVALVVPMLLILIVELLNTAIEATVDRVGLEHHDLSGLAKDLGSAAVFVSLAVLVVVWLLVLWPRLA